MRFRPVFLDVTSHQVAPVSRGEHAVNKLRLLRAAPWREVLEFLNARVAA